ncbi:MAG: hypothetical protein WDO14_06445 [Bacteroidota bacterium]
MGKGIGIFAALSAVVIVITSMTPEEKVELISYRFSKKDSAASVKAFAEVYRVLMSPRCMNCHPKGDVPLQGDDSHLHTMQPQRGKEGIGMYAMKCTNCHQATNSPGLHTPPGNPKWHLPPAVTRMVFEGKSANELAKQLIDRKMNGNKTIPQLIEHASDTLVRWAWEPGEGRTKPPLTHEEFRKVWITWLETGAYAPKK